MSKRFTESEKWRDPWFRRLSPGVKLAWSYISDNCDAAGVWNADKEMAEFSIGQAVPWDKVLEACEGKIEVLANGSWLLTDFIAFQYGTLTPDCRPHLKIIRLCEQHGILPDTLSKGYSKTIHSLQEEDKDKDKEEDKDKKKGSAEGKKQNEAAAIYAEYPRKVAKPEAIRAITKALQKHEAPYLLERTREFARRQIGQDPQFIPYPATWFNGERFNDDPKTWERTTPQANQTPLQRRQTVEAGQYRLRPHELPHLANLDD